MKSKLTNDDVAEIKKLRELGMSYKSIADRYGVTFPTIYYKINDKKYSNRSEAVARSINNSRKKAISLLGGKCKKCGFPDIRALQIDHINGGGNIESKKFGSYHMYLKIKKSINTEKYNYQVLCANCNWIKRYENKETRNGLLHFNY